MLAARRSIYDQDARTISSTQGGSVLGELATTPDGRNYVYSLAGATALAGGKITQAPATTANHVTQTGVATTVGQTQITYTTGATTAVADFYAGGYFAVDVGPGQNLYHIVGNTAITAANSYSFTLTIEDPITVATTTSSKFSLYPNSQASTVLYDHTTIAQQVTGAPNVAVTAAYYYWSQVGGYASILSDGIIAKNVGAIPSDAIDGAVETEVAGTVIQRVGFAPEATVTTTYLPLVLTIIR